MSAGLAGSPDGEGLVLLRADVELVDEAGDDVGLFEVEVIVWAENLDIFLRIVAGAYNSRLWG